MELLASIVILLPLIFPSIIAKSPMNPALAVISPLMVTSPPVVKWKLLELISTLPPLPLTNAVSPPKKNDGVKMFTALPLSVVVPLLNISMLPPLPLIKLLSPPR